VSDTIIFVVGTLVFIATATATFIWGYLQLDALRIDDDRETARADAARLPAVTAIATDETAA
jgi:hypothetical protein